jgi:hypothetical protein
LLELVAVSHSRTVLSLDADATSRPSGEKATTALGHHSLSIIHLTPLTR